MTRPFCQRCNVEWETDYEHHCPTNEEKTYLILCQIAGLLGRIDGHLANVSQTPPKIPVN